MNAAGHITKYSLAGPQGGPMSPFMKSSNSEYGNWFHRGPPSPFLSNNGLVSSPNYNLATRKVSMRRASSYLQNDNKTPLGNLYQTERSIITPLNTTARADVANQHSSSRPVAIEESQFYGQQSPRGGFYETVDIFAPRKGMLERSTTTFETLNPSNLEKSKGGILRRSRTFTEGITDSSSAWKSLSPRKSQPSHFNTLASTTSEPSGNTPFGNTSGLALPTVSNSTASQRSNAIDPKSHSAYSGLPLRSPMYMLGPKEQYNLSSDITPQDTYASLASSSTSYPSANPYSSGDMSFKTYRDVITSKPDSPRNNHYNNESSTYYSKTGNVLESSTRHISPDNSFSSGRNFPKAVKSILKKKSAYEVSSGYLGFTRLEEDNGFLRGWAGYSNPSAFTSFVSSSTRQQGNIQNEADKAFMQNKQRTSAKRVTFLL